MRKFGVFNLFIFCAILLAGMYGAIHDQITYSLSPEYFTRFKYEQSGFEPGWFGGHRPTVAVIGFFATWWTGMFVGLILGALSLVFPDHRTMASALRRAIVIPVAFSAGFAVLGGLYGRFYLSKAGVDWWIPENLVDRTGFITVGSIHRFSYLGGLCGLVAGICFLIRLNRQIRHRATLKQVSS